MNEFLDKLLKIQSDYFRRMQFFFILDLISFFSIFYAMFIIFQVEYFLNKSSLILPIPVKIVPPILAFVIAIIGAFLSHRKDHKVNVILLIESKYPELKEKLRTAYDNRAETNVIVESLKSLVLSGLMIGSASKLIATSVVVTKIILVTIFISGAAEVSYHPEKYALPPETITSSFTNITGIGEEAVSETIVVGMPETLDDKVAARGAGEIFGKPKIASIEGKDIDLTLYSGVGTGFDPIKDASKTLYQFIRSAQFPVDVVAANVSDGGYGILMRKTEVEKKLIEDYAVERSKI